MKIMNQVFSQKRGLNSKRFTLSSDKILVERRSMQSIDKYEVKLDRIGYDIQYSADNKFGRSAFLIICFGVPVLLTICELLFHNIGLKNILIGFFCFYCIGILILFKQPNDNIFLTGGDINLVFFRNVPSEEKVLSFIKIIIATAKLNLKEKYITNDTSFEDGEFLSVLKWLKQTEVITGEEYELYKQEYEVKRLLG
jgi:hypothetical protein